MKESQQTTRKKKPFQFSDWIIGAKATKVFSNKHFWILLITTLILAYIYYFVLHSFHDIYVVLFFYPLIYVAIVYRLRGVLICGLILLGIALPRIIIFSYDIYALIRTLVIGAFAFIISGLSAILLNYLESQKKAYEEIQVLNNELHQNAKNLENTQKKLVQSEKLKTIGQISASIAHEINNPLAGVLVYTRLLSKKLQNDTFDRHEALTQIKSIDDAIQHSSRITGGLLDFSRRADPVFKPVDVSEIIDRSLILVGHQAAKKNIKIDREEADNLSQIYADSGQMVQVIINLVNNAVQATDKEGKITIKSFLSEDNLVTIAVCDSGIGIPEENMDKLFTPFFSTKEEIKGLGIGLWISYRIISNHGGKIMVDSEVGEGSTFTIYLPRYYSKEINDSLLQNIQY
jgi:two-component system NtrC family sensor kinase